MNSRIGALKRCGVELLQRPQTLFLLLALVCFASHESPAQIPDLAVRYFQAGQKRMQEGDWLSAAEDFTKAIATDAQLNRATLPNKKGDAFGALKSDRSEISVTDPFTAYAYASRGLARLNLGDFDQAIEDYARALRIRPKLTEAYLGRGIALDAEGEYDRAVLDYDRAISIDPKSAEAYFRRGCALVKKQNFAAAVGDFERALAVRPNFAWAQLWLGTSLMKEGRYEGAVIAFTAALKLDPGIAEAYGNRGLAFLVLGREPEALKDLKESVDLKPELKGDLERRTELAKQLVRANVARLLSQ